MVFRCSDVGRHIGWNALLLPMPLHYTLPVSLSPSSNQKFIYRPYGYDLLGAEWLHCLPAKCFHLECFDCRVQRLWSADCKRLKHRSSIHPLTSKVPNEYIAKCRLRHTHTYVHAYVCAQTQTYRDIVYLEIDIHMHIYIRLQCVWLRVHTSDRWAILESEPSWKADDSRLLKVWNSPLPLRQKHVPFRCSVIHPVYRFSLLFVVFFEKNVITYEQLGKWSKD